MGLFLIRILWAFQLRGVVNSYLLGGKVLKQIRLAKVLQENGFEAVLCLGGADTTIVKTALEVVGEAATVLADDIDILCLLPHHVYFNHRDRNVFLKIMRSQRDTEERFLYNIHGIIVACDKVHIEYSPTLSLVATQPLHYTDLVKQQFSQN